MDKIVTIQRHIMEQQALHPAATGEFTRLLWDLVLAFKMISREVNRAGLLGPDARFLDVGYGWGVRTPPDF